jgi:hypothetical protein
MGVEQAVVVVPSVVVDVADKLIDKFKRYI